VDAPPRGSSLKHYCPPTAHAGAGRLALALAELFARQASASGAVHVYGVERSHPRAEALTAAAAARGVRNFSAVQVRHPPSLAAGDTELSASPAEPHSERHRALSVTRRAS
jgi:hypothetical protein